MIDTSKLSDEPIPGIEESYSSVGLTPPAGVYHVRLSSTDNVRMFFGETQAGRPFTSVQSLQYRILAGATLDETEGVPVGAVIFDNNWMNTIVRSVYTLTQLREDGVSPITPTKQAVFLDSLVETKTPIKVKVDWEAFDTELYNDTLILETKSEDYEEPLVIARQKATDEQKAKANKLATLARSFSDFPHDDAGNRIGEIEVKDDDGEVIRTVTARLKITRYFLAR